MTEAKKRNYPSSTAASHACVKLFTVISKRLIQKLKLWLIAFYRQQDVINLNSGGVTQFCSLTDTYTI